MNAGLYDTVPSSTGKFLVKPLEACSRYSRGRNSMMADAEAAGAVIRLGRSVLISIPKMDAFYTSKAGE